MDKSTPFTHPPDDGLYHPNGHPDSRSVKLRTMPESEYLELKAAALRAGQLRDAARLALNAVADGAPNALERCVHALRQVASERPMKAEEGAKGAGFTLSYGKD